MRPRTPSAAGPQLRLRLRLRLQTLAALLLLTAVMLTQARADVAIPAHIQNDIPHARLAGADTFRWFGLRVYDAQLWVGDQGLTAGAPHAQRFALDLRYARTLSGQKIAQASVEQMQKLGFGTPTQHADWLRRMEQLFPDVADGVHLTGIHLPDGIARFYLDGKLLGEVNDAAFAQAFFAIWLDPKTTAPALRTALLKNAAPR